MAFTVTIPHVCAGKMRRIHEVVEACCASTPEMGQEYFEIELGENLAISNHPIPGEALWVLKCIQEEIEKEG